MEIQFQQSQIRYLHNLSEELQTQEQTQEVRLPDGMPDIGRVLGTWGQMLLRGKEWRNGSVNVSGGVMAWALYEPEEGGLPQTVEAWIPFQTKWDIPQTQHDGVIQCAGLIRNVDARSTSARKLMFRANVSMLGQAFVPEETAVFNGDSMPEDVQILKNTYPIRLPKEAGEKAVELEETLNLPGSAPKIRKLIRFSLQPELIDRRVMADKVVFRGMAIVHILYCGEDDGLHGWDFELPFSQYAQLEGEYGEDASARILPAVTALEMDQGEDGTLSLNGSMTCQYLVYDRQMLELVEDAYSPGRQVQVHTETIQLPAVLEELSQTIRTQETIPLDGLRSADLSFCPAYPHVHRVPDGINMQMQGQFQLLYYDNDGNLQSVHPKWEDSLPMNAAEKTHTEALICNSGVPQAIFMGNEAELRADCLLETRTEAMEPLTMVTAIELGEAVEMDPNRPSIVLRRPGNDSLWELAKRCGSTVEKIKQANGLTTDPVGNGYLLIPVI